MSYETPLAADQEHRDAGHIEQERREIEVSSLRNYQLRSVTRKAKREPQSDQREIHVIVDNLSAQTTNAVQAFLEAHPTAHLHFTPTYASWLPGWR
jgi:DDE superfamily endonuclease